MDLPHLIFPTFRSEQRTPRQAFGRGLVLPDPEAQGRRLTHKLETITKSLHTAQLSIDGLDPQQVIVFEVIPEERGSLLKLAEASDQIPGLEWLNEVDVAGVEPRDGFAVKESQANLLPLRLFAVYSNQRAMDYMLSLWQQWQKHPNEHAKRGTGPFRDLFKHLLDVRRWSAKDRILDTGIEDVWRQDLLYQVDSIRFEAELWYYSEPSARGRAIARARELARREGGTCISHVDIQEIRYLAMLLECPARAVEQMLSTLASKQYTQLLQCEDVMFFRPKGQTVFEIRGRQGEGCAANVGDRPTPSGEPIVALVDGLPLTNHESLKDRLIVDDPDDFATEYSAEARQHGTAMASLVIHGDLGSNEPLQQPVYVRPVMKPIRQPNGYLETFPEDRLFVDLFHRAVRRIVEGDGEEAPTAPTVRIVNVSLGNPYRPFIRELSPLARLIDWLAWKYKLLFIVSAGNHRQALGLSISREAYESIDDKQAVRHALKAMWLDARNRCLLSPAESLNALTVGAAHVDAWGEYPLNQRIDPLRDHRLCSPVSTVSGGFRRAVKPEILMPGGRQLYRLDLQSSDRATLICSSAAAPPGQRVAAPGRRPGEIDRYIAQCGSSNAAALATRLAARIHDHLLLLRQQPNGVYISDELMVVLTKTLLAHGASWRSTGDLLDDSLEVPREEWQRRREAKARFMGYGEVDPTRVLSSNEFRVVLLGSGRIAKDQGHVYEIPIPEALGGKRLRRRVVATVAWISPVNPRHRKYRRANLYLAVNEDGHALFGSTKDADEKLAGRGTVQHLIYEKERAEVVTDGDVLLVRVSCSEEAGKLVEAVPYGLAITLEVDPAAKIPIYEPIRNRIQQRVQVRST